jgi:hypothetical protein
MKTRYLIIPVFLLVLLLIFAPVSSGARHGRYVTPYGDFCRECGQYGTCKNMMKPGDSRKALIDYFKEKGLEVEVLRVKGRFIKANIKDSGEIVDIIIFDRKNGRIRSIY